MGSHIFGFNVFLTHTNLFQNTVFPKICHRIFSDFSKIEATMGGTSSLVFPCEKKILVPRTKARKRRDGVITLVWQLQSQKDTDHNVFPISNLFVMAHVVNAQNSEVSSLFK